MALLLLNYLQRNSVFAKENVITILKAIADSIQQQVVN